jgi:FMN phosphatase YigB (HAD superfamily)
MTIRLVTLDVDGTLYRREDVSLAMAWKNLRRLRAMRIAVRVREELRGRTFPDGAALRREEARMAAERLQRDDVDATRALLDDIVDRTLCEALAGAARRRAAPLGALLSELGAGGIALAVISDRRVHDKLAALGLDGVAWCAALSADDSGQLKPSAAPFLAACAAAGVSPEQALHLGDRDDSDGAGARAAGMQFKRTDGPAAVCRALEPLRSARVA